MGGRLDPYWLDYLFDPIIQGCPDADHVLFYGLLKLCLGMCVHNMKPAQRAEADRRYLWS